MLKHAAENDQIVSTTRPLVLVVDDVAEMRELFVAVCDHFGYSTVTASTAAEAIQQALVLQPAVILMDLCMPGVDGWGALRLLKQDARTRDIPVVVVSGLPVSSEEPAAAAAEAILRKPCSAPQIASAIQGAVARRQVYDSDRSSL